MLSTLAILALVLPAAVGCAVSCIRNDDGGDAMIGFAACSAWWALFLYLMGA